MVSASVAPSGASRASSPTSCAGADGVPPGSTSTRTSRSPFSGVASASFGRGSWNPAHRSAPPPPARRPRAAPGPSLTAIRSPRLTSISVVNLWGPGSGASTGCEKPAMVGRGPCRRNTWSVSSPVAPRTAQLRIAPSSVARVGAPPESVENERARRGASELRAASHLVRRTAGEVASEPHGAFGACGRGCVGRGALLSGERSGAPARRRPGRGPRPPPKPPPAPSAASGWAARSPAPPAARRAPRGPLSGRCRARAPCRRGRPSHRRRRGRSRLAQRHATGPPGGRLRGPRRPAPASPRRRARTPGASGDSCRG